jgi:phosphohistidine phosphatase
MDVFLLRHGIAENGRPGMPDSDRALTAEGRRKLREVLRTAQAARVSPDYILTSPYRRARETAEIAAEVLKFEGELLTTHALTPDSRPEAVWEEVRLHKDASQILLCGHEPLFSHLTAFLLDAAALRIDFKKGALARVEIDSFGPRPRGILRWFLAPRLAGGRD